ncbi:hypothetical protein [Actinomycetospora sp. TBRC 11914]|uniref:hypothetical protein n=1 Tax=Actinomycetospora sp. TBRC 11914 TaxID=2729387 RepID=UPI00145D577C|nr:hypothetical protein [Actinomycetospora sp. TBRC 11914]NMO90816.1 hypothetical protein [Actinomycetospora sp. TBRC 11914]
MSRRESEPVPGGAGASRWWGKAVVACASLAALAGTVAAVATAAGADGEQAGHAEAARDAAQREAAQRDAAQREAALRVAADASRQPTPVPAADTAAAAPRLAAAPGRAGAPSLGATVQVLPGWAPDGSQDLVPVPPGRFPTVVTLADRAAVLVGRLDPARGFGRDALADEARRLVGAFADGAMRQTPGDRARIADVSDDAGTLDGRDAHTTVRRVTTADGPGSLVRVTTVAGGRGEPGLVLLAVAGPGPRQAADATAADRVVRSLSSAPAEAPPAAGRAAAPPASAAPGLPPRPGVSRAPVAGPPSSRPPVSRPPARPAPPTDR